MHNHTDNHARGPLAATQAAGPPAGRAPSRLLRYGLVASTVALGATLAACSSSGTASTTASHAGAAHPAAVTTPAAAAASTPVPTSESTPATFEIDALTGMKFSLPSSNAPAGAVRVTLVNKAGDMPHEADLFLLHHGVTAAQFKQSLLSAGGVDAAAKLADPAGGPAGVMPGQRNSVLVDLKPSSTYAVICQIPATDGKPHFQHGMVASFHTAATASGTMPAARTNVVTMTDDKYAVAAGIDWTKPITVANKGHAPHQMQILGAAPGKTLTDVANYLKLPPGKAPAGPPPYVALGGVAPIAPGGTEVFTPQLKPGRYLLVCFVVDPKTHAPHFAMGMLTPFTVS